MARKLPARDAKGRFKKTRRRKSSSRRKRRTRRNTPSRDSMGRFVSKGGSSRRRSRRTRSNPRMDIVGSFTDGAVTAGRVLIGKAGARSVPDLLGLPKEGNVGLAIQAAVALGLGYAAEMFMDRQTARDILAGGLTAPMETLIVAYNVPWLSGALAPTTAADGVGAYMGRYMPSRVTRRNPGRTVAAGGNGMGRFVDSGLGMYASN